MWIDPDTFFRLTNGGEEARLGGIMMNPNELGMLAGVGVACLIFDLYRKKSKVWTVIKILVIFYALFMTGSRSSLIGVLFFHINQTKKRGLKLAIIAGVLMVIPFAVNQIILKGGDPKRLEEILTLTGRLPFWQALITEGLPREPLLGFGYMRIDYKEFFQSVHTYPGKMTHNTLYAGINEFGFYRSLYCHLSTFFYFSCFHL
jgi:O-antigen ligase